MDKKEQKYRQKYDIPFDALLAVGTDGYVSFDGHYVTLQKTGLGRLTVGKGVKRVPITSISSVQIKSPGSIMAGFIQFSIPGGNEARSAFGTQSFNAAQDENSMMFIKKTESEFLAMRNAIEAAQRERTEPAKPAVDVLSQLDQLAKLRDAGIVTNSEFELKKAELLSRM